MLHREVLGPTRTAADLGGATAVETAGRPVHVSNRSIARLLAGRDGSTTSAAPENEGDQPVPEPIQVTEEYVPEEGTVLPHAMINGGRTGNVVWAGGGGAGPHGNEAVGSVQVAIPPVYMSVSHGLLSDSEAWVLPGTGMITVVRSFVGSNSGDQGNGWWVTPAAAARLDQHEQLHVTMTTTAHDTHLAPMVAKMTDRRRAYTQSGAIDDLKAHIGWEAALKAFATWDDLFNFPMKAVDTVDLASGTYVVNAGPGTVAGTPYTNILRLPSEPNPAP